jgi:hypothetical protein
VDERVGQDLQRNITIQLRIARPIHLAHAPFTDQGGNLVRTKSGAWAQGHGSWPDYTAAALRSNVDADAR